MQNRIAAVSKHRIINFDKVTGENQIKRYLKWSHFPDHPYRMLILIIRILIIGSSGSGKTNMLLTLANHQPDIDKIYLYAKNPYEPSYQLLINKREKVDLKHYNDPKVFMEYSNDMQDAYKNIEEYNPGKKREVVIVFNDDVLMKRLNEKFINLII